VEAGRVVNTWQQDNDAIEAKADPATVEAFAAYNQTGDLLEEVRALLVGYVSFPSEHAATAVALWAMHAHAVRSAESTPRLALLSPVKQSGKTRTLEVLDLLTPSPMHTVNCSVAALFRAVSAGQPTLLMDEADTYFGPRSAEIHEELRAMVNAGHRRGAVAHRCVGQGTNQEVREFPAFAALALAGIGDLPDTVLDRAVVITMKRRAPADTVRAFRLREAKPEGDKLRRRLAGWARANAEELESARPVMPDGIADRPADCWEPLLAIADLAEGDWPKRARAAAVALNAERVKRDPALSVRLLGDLRAVFDDRAAMHTETVLEELCNLDESPWGDLRGKRLDGRGLAARLRGFDVRPKDVWLAGTTKKGYTAEDLHDAWLRYL
jgi:hypothetical protein